MIKTFAYNEFDFQDYRLDKQGTLQDIEDFIKQGGNLNHPVKKGDNFIPAFKFLEENLGVDSVTQLIEKKYLISPGQWTINEKTKTIIESNMYHSYWYRDNYNQYSKIISEGFRNLCKTYVSNPVFTAYEYTDQYSSHAKSNNMIVRKEEFNPLLTIVMKMPFKEIFNVFLEEVPNAKQLLNENFERKRKIGKEDSDPMSIYNLIVRDSKDKQDIISSLFKYNIVDMNTLIEDYNFNDSIKKAISENDFEFMHILQSQSDNPQYIGQLDQPNSMYNSFLRHANSPEMAKLLIDAGCPVLKHKDEYDVLLFSHEYFPASRIDTIKFIIDYVPMNYMQDYEVGFWEYLKKSGNIDQFKEMATFMVSKGFPIEKYDLFDVCPGDDWAYKIQTCLDLGANPNKFNQLIERIVRNRDVSKFKAINKTKLLNLYSPDGIYSLLNVQDHTKSTLDLLDKADLKDMNSLTSFGKPAWFAANSKDKINKILSKVSSFNQLDKDGNNWITSYYSLDIADKHSIAPLIMEMSSIEDSKHNRTLDLSGNDNQSNVLHYGFKFDRYKTKELREEFIDMIKCFNTSNLNELLSSLDEHGLFPIDYLIKSKKTEGVWNKSFWDVRVDSLLNLAEYNLDYDKKNIDGQSLIESLRNFYKIDDMSANFIEPVEKAYTKYQLYHKLDNKLVADNRKSIKNKI